MDVPEARGEPHEPLHVPASGERQLTFRALACGALIGGIVAAMNLYVGLKMGWSLGGSLMAAILGFALFAAIDPDQPYTILETNITQTVASGAGAMVPAAGMTAAIPAMKMLGHDIPVLGLFAWSAAVAYLGVMFAVPLRRQYVVVEQLHFPSGTVTATTIVAMFARVGEAVARGRALLLCGLFAFAYVALAHFAPDLEHPRLHVWLGSATLTALAAWGFSIHVGPMLFGIGLLVGPRVGSSLAVGGLLGWGLLAYAARQQGWASHANPMTMQEDGVWGPAGWILWPGVALMLGEALASLALSWRTVQAALWPRVPNAAVRVPADERAAIPNSWWVTGLALVSAAILLTAWIVFAIPPYLSILAISLSAVLSSVAVRSVGETGINPVGPMGQVSQGTFGALTDSVSTNLMAAGITGAGASQAADMMLDFKAGHLLGASPRRQFQAQLLGAAIGALCVVPIYLLFDHAWHIGAEDSQLRAPAAQAWRAVAEVVSQGFDALPHHASTAMFISFAVGVSMALLPRLAPGLAPYMPSGLAIGIAFLVPPFLVLPIFLGALVQVVWQRVDSGHAERFLFAVACGLIAGEGLAGLLRAALELLGAPVLIG